MTQIQIQSPIETVIQHVTDLADFLDTWLQGNEDSITLEAVEKLYSRLTYAAQITIDPTSDRSSKQDWELVKAEASQIESDRTQQEEADAAFWAEQDRLNVLTSRFR